MWNFASKCLAGTGGLRFRIGFRKLTQGVQQLSDNEASSTISREEGLECPICYESFNIVENVPYVLWCGHSLCKNCVLGLRWAIVKIPPLPIQLPLLISCPWCNLLSPRLVLQGNLRFPRKNYFLLWMVERLNDDKLKKSRDDPCSDSRPSKSTQISHSNVQRFQSSGSTTVHDRVVGIRCYVQKCLLLFVELTAKFPLVLISLLIVLYVIPASATILVLYVLLTILFVLPSCLVLYFAYPSLDWLVKEIMA
ncbi:uncharacterized protein LOC112520411 [Cynara cardunculus var. scolymus]|uniref:RING-type domain-containing protein n=1 Tax=Cynara cardunculus var. scolymus TaxID=59895 RepID=A0A118K5H9_CYNCS|nr:uncharacterized protein LOC112520411 [Cynara cardunculus var. scolymus]KVI09135.1 hypothetical protein Ccrd_012534 [Cynara cardunculus var. scolymus]